MGVFRDDYFQKAIKLKGANMEKEQIPSILKFGTICESNGVLRIDGFHIDMNNLNLSSAEVVLMAIIKRLQEELKQYSEPKTYECKLMEESNG